MTKASDNVFPRLLISEGGSTSTPASGNVTVYAKANGLLYSKDDAGAETALGGAGSSGALVLLEQHTASASATLDFTTFISATYDTYKIIGTDLTPASNAVDLTCRIGTGGGPTYDSGTNYEWGFSTANNGSTGVAIGGTGATSAKLMDSVANNAGYGFGCFEMTVHNLQSTAHRKAAHWSAVWTTSTPTLRFASGGFFWITTGTAVTALRFLMSSGNIASGTIRAYGIAK